MRLLELVRPYRVIVTRRVTEEEQVSVESFHRDVETCEGVLKRFLGVFRDHRKRTNEEVVSVTRQQVASLDTQITARGEEIHRLDEEIEKKRLEVRNLDGMLKQRRKGLPSSPFPTPIDGQGKIDG